MSGFSLTEKDNERYTKQTRNIGYPFVNLGESERKKEKKMSDTGPLLLLKVDEESAQINVNHENLDYVLEKTGNRPLSIISIVGLPNQGKRFLLGHIIRCLKSMEEDEADWMDWENPDKPLTDFLWPPGQSPQISGTWICGRPFLVNIDSKEIAVLVLATQASQQAFLNDKKFAAVAGFNLAISSCVIFNTFKQLPENFICALGSFIKLGLTGVSETENKEKEPPFQRLTFLIRDWSYPTDYPYGAKGGSNFLNMRMEAKRTHPGPSKQVRQFLKTCFQSVDCYVMPFPGQKAIMPEFTGAIGSLEPLFAKKLEDFISTIISTEDLTVRQISGKDVTSQDFKNLIKSYTENANSGNGSEEGAAFGENAMSNSKSSPRTSSRIKQAPQSNTQILKTAMKRYTDVWKKHSKENSFFPDATLQKTHKSAYNQALEMLRKVSRSQSGTEERDMEDDDAIAKQAEKQLKRQVTIKFKEIQEENLEKRSEFEEQSITECIKTYEESMSATFPKENFHIDTMLMKTSTELIQSLMEDFIEKLGEDEDDLMGTLQAKLKQAEKRILQLNTNNRVNTEQFQAASFNETLSHYKSKMVRVTQQDAFAECTALHLYHETESKVAVKRFREKLESSGVNPVDPAVIENLRRDVNKFFDETMKNHKASIENAQAQTQKLISEMEELYGAALQSESQERAANLQAFHEEQLHSVRRKFKEKLVYPAGSSQFAKSVETLTGKLTSLFTTLLKEKDMIKKESEKCIADATRESCNLYQDELQVLFKQRGFVNAEELHKINANLTKRAIDKYLEVLKHGNVNQSLGHTKTEVEGKLAELLLPFKAENEKRRKIALSQSENIVNDCLKEYEKTMNSQMSSARTLAKLTELHETIKAKVISSFQEKCPVKEEDEIQIYLSDLKEKIEETFEEVQEIYALRVNNDNETTKEGLRNARKFYNEEMEKHFKYHEFIRPDQLLALHEEVSGTAISKCYELLPLLTQDQKQDLEEALQKTFEKYKEENDMNLQDEPAIGIDLGTTYSCAAIYAKGRVHIIRNGIGKNTTPSYVAFHEDGSEVVGEPAKNRAYENPENTIFDAKRILGRKFADKQLQSDIKLWPFSVVDDFGVPKVVVGGKKMFPEEISAKVLRELKNDAEKYLNKRVKKAVITVPAYFTDGQKQATIDAGKVAGLEVLNILTEPTAAAIAYRLQHTDEEAERHVLIFDLGGGTFDVAVLKMSQGKIDVLAVDGDTHLGGEDFDRNMMEFCAKEFARKHKIDLFEGKDSEVKVTRDDVRRRLRRLQGECERKKIELTSARGAEVFLDNMHGTKELKVLVTRDRMNEFNASLYQNTIRVVDSVLAAAQMDKSKIDDIVLVGGSTRIPKIQMMLEEHFGGKALDCSINPDEAVAYGAAIKAAIMNGAITRESTDFTQIQDVTPMSLGVEVYGGGFSVIIPKSTNIPVKLQERYKTAHNNQTSVQIIIYQGEEAVAAENQMLGEFYLNGIPPNDAEAENIDVEMVINAQGILHVNAVCSSTGTSESSTISVTENKQRMGQRTIRRLLTEADAREAETTSSRTIAPTPPVASTSAAAAAGSSGLNQPD